MCGPASGVQDSELHISGEDIIFETSGDGSLKIWRPPRKLANGTKGFHVFSLFPARCSRIYITKGTGELPGLYSTKEEAPEGRRQEDRHQTEAEKEQGVEDGNGFSLNRWICFSCAVISLRCRHRCLCSSVSVSFFCSLCLSSCVSTVGVRI